MLAPTIDIYPNVSRTDHVKDIRKGGHKTVLVRRSGVDVGLEVSKNYDKVELMYPMIKKYCESVHKRPRQTRWFGRQVSVTHIYTTRLAQSHVWPE